MKSNFNMMHQIMRLELFLGPSDKCHSCGAIFLAYSDGCPNCGGYQTSKLHPIEDEGGKWDMETYPIEIFNPQKGDFEGVDKGDFSPYPSES